ncbi:uncharacterized protein [Nicotiana tomentosiformis]|uniref:uncharacterized protein n=1 Tax=Nicotiana tomentosiformis TaxID=4098 RepID=UPI00388CA403
MGKISQALNSHPKGALPSDTVVNPKGGNNKGHAMVVTTRSGRGGNAPTSSQRQLVDDEQVVEEEEILNNVVQANNEVQIDIDDTVEETQEEVNPSRDHVIDIPGLAVQKAKVPLPKPPPPYPQRLAKKNVENQFKEFIDMLKYLSINVTLVEALEQMPGYAKFMKDLRPLGVIEDVLVRVDKFIFLEDFVILDYEVDYEVPIIIGRPSLATRKALVDVEAKELTFQVGDENVVDSILAVLQKRKKAIGWTLAYIRGIIPAFYMHNINLEEDAKPSIEYQRRLNEAISWTSLVKCVPKKEGTTVVTNDKNELIPTRTVIRWRVCMDYHKLNKVTRKDHFPLPFLDQILDRLADRAFYCFLDGYSGSNQILIAPKDHDKTTFICPYGTFSLKRMPFGLCNAPTTFQRCMIAIFTDMVEDYLEVFMDDFSVVGDSFGDSLANLDRVLARCEETNLVLNWEKCYFMVEEGIVLGHKISKNGIERLEQFWATHQQGFSSVNYASKTMNDAQVNYTVTEKELLAIVFAIEKFCPYLIGAKVIVHMDHAALRYLMSKKDSKAWFMKWVLLLQEFDIDIQDRKGSEN